MEQNMNGLSRDLIIHPGETLAEILSDKEMTQKELSVRTGFTEKHVSTVVKGTRGISPSFAKKLEYVLGISATFWNNLQSNYEKEISEFEDANNISKEEIEILKPLKDIISYFCEKRKLNDEDNEAVKVLELRKLLGVGNLTYIPNIKYNAAFRAQIASNANVYVLFAWLQICESVTSDIEITKELDINKLKCKIPEIKQVMFCDANEIQEKLGKIFAECGIVFRIVKHFKGAPVQGFIKTDANGRIILCMTIRRGFADIFWFTLFHEIGHIINGDAKLKFIDFESAESETELKANKFASDILLNQKEYDYFIKQGKYSLRDINEFALSQNVPRYIVIGRMQKEDILDYGQFTNEKVRYCWA
ncbi:TPA: HigA family addiction module antitoxin [Clostridioides difficile]|uniref:HigA family addiction module antitoxin n=1 Tax=Clostridioides difficile TaxID=1496 RepID=UPI00038CC237|nr:HigA family addiction module antitoxin [Clostridioides difficile]AXU54318.1 addiction module antidote protein, HigA family [Clostridioides difficile]EGT3738732.1 addiction module antidote protein, HigA family [Clostridioides difficile]EGT3791853.1 addiction module antidote protein, HigA family [Clostridioides difficile]EGT4736933.1 addiction module antidote protein, HigA family [Clostridioides difficile]EGT4845764.1 addiction module antidote protein, HigA family [Clostridioides difficile]